MSDQIDDDAPLAHAVIHLNHRVNQALGEAMEYEQTGRDEPRFAALAELEAVRDEITEILDEAAGDEGGPDP
jgi:hypothetical protein